MAELPSGTVTFLFTDVEGSTRLWEEHPDEMRVALARHDEILRVAISSHGGHVVKARGDGVHAAFRTAHDAIGAAVEMQRAFAVEEWAETGVLRVRVGIHTGECQERDGDYFGSAVNLAARVMAVAHGGQIVCSRATVAVAGETFVVRNLGEHRLRDLAAPQELFQVGEEVFPPLRSVDVVTTNLPIVRTELIGRADDVAALSHAVRNERLVTLTGVGGVGKTRLALGVAGSVASEFVDGCWLVELAPVGSGDDIATVVSAAMNARAAGVDALARYLSDRRALIVLDNCEHVLDAAAELVDAVLSTAPDVHVVATSREPLGVDGEVVRRVHSLAVPDPDTPVETAAASPAVRLFDERAATVADGFTIDPENVDAVVEICRHLDGIPLAIELAAARVATMAPAQIARRLDERFRLLDGGLRRAQERHRTLSATVAWSHDLLSEDEKLVFRRLAVFPASFDLDAAEAVGGDDAGELDVIACVSHLVNRSLVDYDPDTDRYKLLETLRQFAADRLSEAAEAQTIRARHARWFLDRVERVAPGIDDARFQASQAILIAELENLRATAEWCRQGSWWPELATMSRLLLSFLEQEAPADGAAWLQDVVDHPSELDTQDVVDALGMLAWIEAVDLGDLTQGIARAHHSVRLAETEHVETSPWAKIAMAMANLNTGQYTKAVHAAQQGLVAAEARNDERAAIVAVTLEASALPGIGDLERSAQTAAEALRRAERTANPPLIVAAVIAASTPNLWAFDVPDFAACYEILDRHGRGLRSGGVNDMWLDLTWGATLLGLDHPGAVEYLARGARAADRLNIPQGLNQAVLCLVIAAADAGFLDHAATLAAYEATELRAYRHHQRGEAWLQARIDQALANHPAAPLRGQDRRDIMNIINDLDTAVAQTSQPKP